MYDETRKIILIEAKSHAWNFIIVGLLLARHEESTDDDINNDRGVFTDDCLLSSSDYGG